MTRPREKDRHLPACVYVRHGAYWHVERGKWTRLGGTLYEALAEYAKIHEAPQGRMACLIEEALAHIRPNIKISTAKQYAVAARILKRKLVQFAPQQDKPKHVAQLKMDCPSFGHLIR